MKKLILPAVIALLAGLGGGTGFGYMRATKQYVADSTHLADSLKAHPKADSTKAEHGAPPHDSAAVAAHPDSAALPGSDSTHAPAEAHAAQALAAVPAAKTPTAEHAPAEHAAPAATPAPKSPAPAAPAAKTPPAAAPVTAAATPAAGKPAAKGMPDTAKVSSVVRQARTEAGAAIPEQRLAKIFTAMSPKDAAKVLEQMPEADVRTIVGLMSNKSAAAILAQFPAARAAAISKATGRDAGSTP